jgi:two-component system, NarL family, sensor histidine kinase UhpB
MNLRLQVNLIISSLLMLFASVLVGLQMDYTRRIVREEVLTSNAVAIQLLSHMQWSKGSAGLDPTTRYLQEVGKIRAIHLELRDDEGTLVYTSLPSVESGARQAPEWFSALVSQPLQPKVVVLPIGRIVLRADTSLAVLDGWDDLCSTLWAGVVGLILGNVLVYALMGRTLRPLSELLRGLRQMAKSQYDTRLEELKGREGREISKAFNDMAQSVQERIEAKRQAIEAREALAENRELTQMIQDRIELEHAAISRELHDELGQHVTAIKSAGLTISRRSGASDPTLEQSARLVIECADRIYEGMHRMIATLRPIALDQFGLYDALRDLVVECQLQHPGLQLRCSLPDTPTIFNAALATAVYRILQEALTNALRHAQASRIDIVFILREGSLELSVRDNGVGQVDQFRRKGHFGLTGMRERVQMLGGTFQLLQRESGGVEILVDLPISNQEHHA